MKNIKSLLIAVLLLVVAGASFAQRGPGHGPRDHRGPGNHGHDSVRKGPPCNLMADSCFQILLGKLSADDAAALTAALDAQKALMDQVNQIRAAAKAAREAGDTAAFRAAMEQLKALRRQGKELAKTIRDIMHRNNTAVREALIACCGEPPHGPRDSNDTKGDHQHVLEVGNIKPNPVPTGVTTAELKYKLKVQSTVTITINDQLGNIVKTVTDGASTVGEHVVSLDLTGLSTGGYLVRVQAGTDVQTRRLIIQ